MSTARAGGQPERRSRLLLVGYGRMGHLVERLSADLGFDVVGIVNRANAMEPDRWPEADVAIDFSVAEAVPANVPRLAAKRVPAVIGTTGWHDNERRVREAVVARRSAAVVAPNFALGVNVFLAIAERAATLLAAHDDFGAWVHELHHQAKRDAPSGTAIALRNAMQGTGYRRPIDVASTRAGSIPGTHTVGFDSPSETITLTHSARDRAAFARGALEAARWVLGREGWFTMRDVIGL